MIFNCDLFSVIAEVEYGLTVPDNVRNTDLYRYFSNLRSYKRDPSNFGIKQFIATNIDDEVFIDYACASAETAKWVLHILDYCDQKKYLSYENSTRLSIAANNMPMLVYTLKHKGRYINCGMLYRYLPVNILRAIYSDRPDILSIDRYEISTKIGRLDVMKMIYEFYPEAFSSRIVVQAYKGNGFREVEALEWLIDNGLAEFPSDNPTYDIGLACEILGYDDSMIRWILKHRSVEAKKSYNNSYKTDPMKGELFISLMKVCTADTLKMFFEKIDNRTMTALLNPRMIDNIKLIYSLMQNDDKLE